MGSRSFRLCWVVALLGVIGALFPSAGSASESRIQPGLAAVPPMGWNCFNAFSTIVTEAQIRESADYLAEHLSRYGYKYVIIDAYWYYPNPVTSVENQEEVWEVTMDGYGRLLPAPNRFPSAANGKGFKALSDYIHGKGLKFGIHVMRGIPRQAVRRNLPIVGTSARAREVASVNNTCEWSTAMYGVDVSNPAGQAYYDSILELYAEWGVDFIKVDDMSMGKNPAGESYHAPEIDAFNRAIRKSGRPIVLSLSPGPTDPVFGPQVKESAHLWRISADFSDNWSKLKAQFSYCRSWQAYIGPDHWPDPDMLPVGRLHLQGFADGPRPSRFTAGEQRTLMTLWSIFRAPLIVSGDLLTMDGDTLALLSNPEVLAVDQKSTHNREVFARGDEIAWAADISGTSGQYLAVFNLGDSPITVDVALADLGLVGRCAVRDLWEKRNLGTVEGRFAAKLEAHGAVLYRIRPEQDEVRSGK